MRLTNPEFCGLFVWGTKRGLQPFFHFGVEIDENELERLHGDNDIRNHNINPAEPYDRTFYGIDQHNGMTLLHQFRTIIDHVNRPGFYAVTLAMPSGKGLANGLSVPLLNRLSDHYHQLYVQGGGVANQIRVGVTEDASAFGDILRSPEFKLNTISVDPPRGMTPKQAFTYSSTAELSSIFDQQGREEIRSVKKLFLFSDSLRSVCPREIPLGLLPPPPVRYDLELQVSGADGSSFQQVTVTATRNGASMPVSGKSGGRVLLSGIREKDEVQIRISQHGYAARTITPAEVKQWLSAQGGNNAQPVQKQVSLSKATMSSSGGSSMSAGGGRGTGGDSFVFEERPTDRNKKRSGNTKGILAALAFVLVLGVIVKMVFFPEADEAPTVTGVKDQDTTGLDKPGKGGGVVEEGTETGVTPNPEGKVDTLAATYDTAKQLVNKYLVLTKHDLDAYNKAGNAIQRLRSLAKKAGNNQISVECTNMDRSLADRKKIIEKPISSSTKKSSSTSGAGNSVESRKPAEEAAPTRKTKKERTFSGLSTN